MERGGGGGEEDGEGGEEEKGEHGGDEDAVGEEGADGGAAHGGSGGAGSAAHGGLRRPCSGTGVHQVIDEMCELVCVKVVGVLRCQLFRLKAGRGLGLQSGKFLVTPRYVPPFVPHFYFTNYLTCFLG